MTRQGRKTNRLSKDGQHTIEFSTRHDGAGNITLQAILDGRETASIFWSGHFSRDSRAEALGGVYGLGGCLMLASEAAQLCEEYISLQAEIEALPEVIQSRLASKRHNLACAISWAMDEVEAAREHGYNEDIGNIPSYDSPKYRAAVAALAQFDIYHPEIRAGLDAAKAAAVERYIRQD